MHGPAHAALGAACRPLVAVVVPRGSLGTWRRGKNPTCVPVPRPLSVGVALGNDLHLLVGLDLHGVVGFQPEPQVLAVLRPPDVDDGVGERRALAPRFVPCDAPHAVVVGLDVPRFDDNALGFGVGGHALSRLSVRAGQKGCGSEGGVVGVVLHAPLALALPMTPALARRVQQRVEHVRVGGLGGGHVSAELLPTSGAHAHGSGLAVVEGAGFLWVLVGLAAEGHPLGKVDETHASSALIENGRTAVPELTPGDTLCSPLTQGASGEVE